MMALMTLLSTAAADAAEITVEQQSPWGVIAPWGIVALAIVAIVRGDLIPSKSVEHIIKTYRAALDEERKNVNRISVALTKLISQSAITIDILRALPKPEESKEATEEKPEEPEGNSETPEPEDGGGDENEAL